MIDKAVSLLKFKKNPGCDGISTEHIRFAHPSLILILKFVFNNMLQYEYDPDNFANGITIPLPKENNRKQSKSADDFRGITLCPVISKIFELCLTNFMKTLKSSSRQFGFKKGVGCSEVIHLAKQTVNYYNIKETLVKLTLVQLI